MATLMKQDGVVREEVAQAFENQRLLDKNLVCCTVENFQIAVTGAPRRPWNLSAAAVFARSFRDAYGIDPVYGEMRVIIKQALVRIKGIIRSSRKSTLAANRINKINQRSRRTSRKEKVCMSSI